MDKNTPNVNISEQELKVLVKALTKSVEYTHKKHVITAFIAGFLIGVCAAVLTVNILNMHKQILSGGISGRLPETGISLKKTDQPPRELQQTRPDVDGSALPKAAATGEAKTDDKPLAAPQVKDAVTVTKSQDEIIPGGIKVYIHYAREKDKKIAEAFSADLITKGYAFVDAENIKHRHRDIRYFHSEDEKAALLLREQFNNFIAGSGYAGKINLKVRYLGKVYPKAQKGSLEVWVFF